MIYYNEARDVQERAPDGRYFLARRVEEHIPRLDADFIEQARIKKVDLMAVSALEVITDEVKAREFLLTAYPLEIARRTLGGAYTVLERGSLDSVFGYSKVNGRNTGITPRDAAKLEISQAYGLYATALGKKSPKVQAMKKVWKLK